jgi:signal transduction histidine kinase/two-component SAPR family response regulator
MSRDAPPTVVDAETVFAGGGEMGARMRAVDWSTTPLGPIASWPQSLKTCVRIVLTSRQPMFVWWGDSLINLYNDAYKSIVGGKHPAALGQPASIVWREIWDQVGPRAAATMRGNEGTYDEALLLIMERNGYPEETYYTFSYSPVPNDAPNDGRSTGGLICANTDDTQRIVGERQLALLRDLAANTVGARTVDDVAAQAAAALATNERDLPFALVYLADAGGRTASLAGASGIQRGSRAAPASVALDDGSLWPLAEVLRTKTSRVIDLDASFGELPTGAWPTPPTRAALLPVAATGETARPGVLVVGLSPFRLFDAAYEGFLGLVVGQLAASLATAQAYEEEKRRREALAELDRAKTTFFSNVSHEFRTPLTLMLGPIDELRSLRMRGAGDAHDANGEREHENVHDPIELLHRNALRLLKLVNTLLDFSRIEAGRSEAVYEPTDLAAQTADLASSFRSAIERAHLALVVDCPAGDDAGDGGEATYVDRDMWEKIVLNLISNALKFTFEGSISVRVRGLDDAVTLEVADTGTGIAAHELPRLFERFHRIEGARSRSHEGSGIGLALVHELVRAHGGEIRVTSRVGEGTTFTVRIPRGTAHLPQDRLRAERGLPSTAVGAGAFVEEALRWVTPDSAEGSGPRSFRPPADGGGAAPRERIVIADDNADMRDYIARLLRDHWDVEAVGDGHAALAAIRREPPDLVLSDVMMPGIDGFALLRALRSDASLRSIPVVLLSARAGAEATAEGLEAGADDYVVKPFAARDLLVRITARLAAVKGIAEQVRLAAELRVASQRLQAAQSVAGIGIFDWSLSARTTYWSPELYTLMGLEPNAVEATPDAWTEALVDEDRDFGWDAFRAAAGAHEDRFEVEVRLKQPDGGARWVRLSTQVFYDDAGAPSRLLGAVVDVQALKEAAAVRARALEDAERTSRAKDEFLATMSHELRTPLNAMLGWARILKHDRSVAKLDKGIAVIERNAVAQARLVSDLLDVSRIISGKLHLAVQQMDLAAAIHAAVDVVRPAADAKGVALHAHIDPDIGAMVADPDRIQQIVWNLLSNAVRFTPAKGSVSVVARRSDTVVRVVVEDTGAGISSADLPHIFDRFRQGDASTTRAHGGLGLGLAIVRYLAEAHGGTVTARSDGPGHGSTFTLLLPVRAVVAHETEVASAPDALDRGPPSRSTRALGDVRALVIDDDEDSLELLRVVLEGAGASFTGARSAAEALEARGPFDIIISDIGMPAMDGYTLMRRVRSKGAGGDTPAIALTAYARAEDEARALAAGYQQHLAKPVDAGELLDAVKRWVRRPRGADGVA